MNHITQPYTNTRHALQTINLKSRLFLWTTIVTGLLFAILIGMTPHGADDLLFLLPAKGHEPGPGLWSMMTGEIPRIWETQSGRLGNFLAMPMLYLMPKWILGILTGGLTALLIILSCKATGTRFGSIVSWLIYATVVLAFPWYDYLTLVTYAINYVWAATAATGAIYCFLHIEDYRTLPLTGVFLLMFIAGWMHEGFGAPLTAGLTLCLLIHRKDADWRKTLAWICAGAGTCMTFLSPVFWQRSDRETNFLLKFTYKELLMQIGPAVLFVGVMILLIVWISSRRPLKRKILFSAPLIIFAIAAAASTAVFLKFYTGPRTGAPAILYSMLACAYILTATCTSYREASWRQWLVGIIIGGFSLVHLSYACISQAERTKEYKEATRLYEDSDDGTFYYDLTYPTPDLTLFKTSVRQFHEKVPKEFMRMYFKPENGMVILPTAMKGFSPEKALKSRLTPGAMIYNGWIVLPDSMDTDSFQRVKIVTGKGEYLPSRFRIDRFRLPGKGYFKLLTPHIKVLDPDICVSDVVLDDHSR